MLTQANLSLQPLLYRVIRGAGSLEKVTGYKLGGSYSVPYILFSGRFNKGMPFFLVCQNTSLK